MCIINCISFGGDRMNKIVNIDKLTYRYKDRFIFDKFCLDIDGAQWITITGPNGSGKTTLIKILLGLCETDSNIYIDNLELNRNTMFEIRKRIGVVFENLDDNFICETVSDDIAFTMKNLLYSKKYISSRINELANMLNIKHLLNKTSDKLSVGEKFKVALACALSHNPMILIIDEVLSTLEESDKHNIIDLLKDLNTKGLTIINITKDLSESYYSDRLLVLNNGSILLDGSPLKVMEYDKVLNKIGVKITFEIELSIKLKLYGVIDKPIYNLEEIVNILWE